jgi:hypothetical protein
MTGRKAWFTKAVSASNSADHQRQPGGLRLAVTDHGQRSQDEPD